MPFARAGAGREAGGPKRLSRNSTPRGCSRLFQPRLAQRTPPRGYDAAESEATLERPMLAMGARAPEFTLPDEDGQASRSASCCATAR